ncbi:response regulator receiver modulated CheB methylesterase [Magnetococcus marinus MC-1]|uniref:Protein-glutamate methylesterase/protein-glutamine glutaminase n=1 Tax=Magnetococcus marinus (strain ATCC BAA-1437 / JCM 17883 / MC-1) TaxID=156889 RepID=A0LDM3_MAGMM|nr:chemotaxis-specific protein-glutamate methyltransferase CheB [Magnetococcus marinus]ABK46066.1 response regulator receiver modulated CheB methylesterase [Magnetococcus marinus MC-1]
MAEKLKAMVVDDTITYRMIMKKVAESIPGVEVVASAPNGKVALEKIPGVQPEVVLCDVEMPVMDGLATLKEIGQRFPEVTVVMVSGLSRSNANIIMECLNAGALDFVTKPLESNANAAMQALRLDLEPILSVIVSKRKPAGREAAAVVDEVSNPAEPPPARAPFGIPNRAGAVPGARPMPSPRPGLAARGQAPLPVRPGLPAAIRPGQRAGIPAVARRPMVTPAARPTAGPRVQRPDLLLIGSSTGGPAALTRVLSVLAGKKLPIPTLIVQHMPPVFTASLASQLSRSSGVEVVEAEAGMLVTPGGIIIAQGGMHMTLKMLGRQLSVDLNQGPKVNECRPAIDVLFMSIAASFSGQTLSVILTGMGRDGTNGVDALKRSSKTYCITQDRDSCVVYGMPRSVEEKGLSDEALPLEQIGKRIQEICGV